MYSESELEQIKTLANKESTLNALGVRNIKDRGKLIRADCPLTAHRSSPQCLTVEQSDGTWICHANCGGGTLFHLVMQVNNVPFQEAVDFVIQHGQAGINAFQPTTNKGQFSTQKKHLEPDRTPQDVLNESSPTDKHPYFEKKCVEPCQGFYFGKDDYGNPSLVIPYYNTNNELQTIQFINESGKYYLRGYKAEGFFAIGSLEDCGEILLAEGIATALTIWMAYTKDVTVISFGSVNNMVKTARALLAKDPLRKLIICLDASDAAYKQAQSLIGDPRISFREPCFNGLAAQKEGDKLTDFNDLVSKCGQNLSVVQEQLMIEKHIPQLPIKDTTVIPAKKDNDKSEKLNTTGIVNTDNIRTSNIEIKFLQDLTINYLTTNAPEAPMLLSVIENSTIKPFLRKGIVGLLVGAGGIGKTHWLTQLAIAIADGSQPFLKQYSVRSGGYVFLGLGENSNDDIHRLLRKMTNGLELNPDQIAQVSKRLAVMSFHGKDASFIKKGKEAEPFNELLSALKKSEPENGWSLIILDPISRFLGAEAETDNAAATQFIALLEKITLELRGCPTILCGHHMSKLGVLNSNTDQTAARGSSALTDGVRWQANLEKGDSDGETRFKVVKSNFTAISSPQILKKNSDGCLYHVCTENETDKSDQRFKGAKKTTKMHQQLASE